MSAKNQHGTCGYCGKHAELTRDHVPQKLLLEQPYPPNLLTVPACYPCNESFKVDDEYTRTVVALDVRAAQNDAARFKLPAIIRSLQYPNARGFTEYLARQTTKTSVFSPDGFPMGEMIKIDRSRVHATGRRLIRGLYFIERGKPVPKTSIVKAVSAGGLATSGTEIKTIARVFAVFPDRRDGATGKAFSYAVAFGSGMSVWLMLLYDYFFWVGSVDEREIS